MAPLVIAGLVNATRAQEPSASPGASPAATASPSPTSAPVPTPIPLAEVVTQAETVQGILRDMNADLAADRVTATVESELPRLTSEIDARINEDTKILTSGPSLETLRRLETDWTTLGQQLPLWQRELRARATLLDREIARLGEMGATWQQTLNLTQPNVPADAAQQEGAPATTNPVAGTPPEIVQRIETTLAAIKKTRADVGDVIQVGEWDGKLRRVGLRASVIRTLEGSEVIVPNGQLISQEVLNWTLSDQQRRLEVDVGVAYGTDLERVIKLLNEVAMTHPDVMREPSPETLFLTFGDSALNFQLRAWTSRFERWPQIRSELTIGVNAALRDAGIAIPFPQRDVHIQGPNDLDKQTARNAKLTSNA